MKNKYEHVILLGDIHGEWNKLFRKLTLNKISEATIICVGDVGIGFSDSKTDSFFSLIDSMFADINVEFIAIRGNHDDPQFFHGNINLPNFKLIPDYSLLRINEYDVLLVGGGISIDRLDRVEGVSYWKDEHIVLDKDKIKKCDILITHACPHVFNPFLTYDNIAYYVSCEAMQGGDLISELKEEGKMLTELLTLSEANKHFCGHLHVSSIKEELLNEKNVKHRLLDIFELYELK